MRDAMDARVIVLGIGNPLVGDEGVGVRVAEALMSGWLFPEGVEVMDAGTMGMGMLGLFSEYEHLIVVDAIDGTGEPAGTVMRLDPVELAPNQVLHSLHDIRLADVIEAAAFTGATPQVEFVGIQIAEMAELVTDLSPAVEAAIPVAVDEVLASLRALGIVPEAANVTSGDAHVIRAIRTREPMRHADTGTSSD